MAVHALHATETQAFSERVSIRLGPSFGVATWLTIQGHGVKTAGLARTHFSSERSQSVASQAITTGTVRILAAVDNKIAADARCGATP